MKTNKSFTKRLKISKNNKVKMRKKGRNHYNAKESNSTKMGKKKLMNFNLLTNKIKARFLPKK